MIEFDPYAYSIQISTETIDGDYLFKATVKELPDVLALGNTYVEAYEEAIDAVKGIFEACTEEGKIFPSPLKVEEEYTGRVTLRMEKSLHRVAVQVAEAEGTSLNSLVATALATRIALGHDALVSHFSAIKMVLHSTRERAFDAFYYVSPMNAVHLKTLDTTVMSPMLLEMQIKDENPPLAESKPRIYIPDESWQSASHNTSWSQ